jgi:hypothetical protein
MDRLKYQLWEMLTGISLILDGVISLITFGFCNTTSRMIILQYRTTGKFFNPMLIDDKIDWINSQDIGANCNFFIGEKNE